MSNLYTVEPFLRDKADRNLIPINGTFELLPMCNMDCKMCYIRLDKKEVDIYLPELNIGIEVNGALSHNSGFSPFDSLPKSPSYHKDKSDLALSKGIRLFHFWEHWDHDKIFLPG